MGIVLLTNAYVPLSPRRADELFQALQRNVKNDAIEEIHLLIEDDDYSFGFETSSEGHARKFGELLKNPKIKTTKLGHRAVLGEFFKYANNLKAGTIVAFANSDIAFDDSVRLLEGVDWEKRILAVSRRDIWRPSVSQDAWIFKVPLPPSFADLEKWWWTLGKPGIDSKLAFEAVQNGFNMANPCLSIVLHHIHGTQERSYSWTADALPGPHGFIFPTDIRPVLKKRPNGLRAVVTTEAAGAVSDITFSLMEKYASRCSASFVVLPATPGSYMRGVFSRYDRVVYLDPEVLVLPGAEDLFSAFGPRGFPQPSGTLPGGILAMLDDEKHTGRWTPERIVEKYERFGVGRADLWGGKNWNTAVMVCDLYNAWIFDQPPKVFFRRPGQMPEEIPGAIHTDRDYISALIRKVDADVQPLKPEYNFMPFLSKRGRPKGDVQFVNLEGGGVNQQLEVIAEFLQKPFVGVNHVLE